MESVLREGSLTGRSALVTGGGTGIGRASAELMAELGARVAIAGRRAELLEETAAAIRAAGGECLPVVCDVREPEAARELVDAVMAAYGSLDVLVNNAGGQFVAPAEEISLKGFRAVTRLNLDAVWELTRLAAVESMLPNGYGKVISVVLSPRRGHPGDVPLLGRARGRRVDDAHAGDGVGRPRRAPDVRRARDDRDRGLARLRRHGRGASRRRSRSGGWARSSEVAQMIAFLASPAGDFVTGTTVVIDGGVDNVDLPPGRGS